MNEHYILKGHDAVPCDMFTWARMFEGPTANRTVAVTEIRPNVRVSTVFLGLNHAFGHEPPMIFETLVFGGPTDDEMERYSTWEQAEAGHARMVSMAHAAHAASFAEAK